MLVAVITQVNGLGAIVGELMCAGTADSERRIGSWALREYLSVAALCNGGRTRSNTPPVMITTFPLTLLYSNQPMFPENFFLLTYWPVESGAIRRILGISSNLAVSAGGAWSCSLSCCRRCFGAEAMNVMN